MVVGGIDSSRIIRLAKLINGVAEGIDTRTTQREVRKWVKRTQDRTLATVSNRTVLGPMKVGQTANAPTQALNTLRKTNAEEDMVGERRLVGAITISELIISTDRLRKPSRLRLHRNKTHNRSIYQCKNNQSQPLRLQLRTLQKK